MERTIYDYGDILSAIQGITPSAHIAGGAVRDTLLKRPIRDIDIFLSDADAKAIPSMLRSAFGYIKVGEWEQYEMFSDPAIAGVAKFEKADETIPICLIALKNLNDHDGAKEAAERNMKRFDFGLCMAAWDRFDIISTSRFTDDNTKKTFTLYRADNAGQFAYSMRRFENLTADRYVGFTLSVPERFEALAKEHSFKQHWYCDYKGMDGPNVMRPKNRKAA